MAKRSNKMVRAAGCLVWRRSPSDNGRLEVMVIHRDRYDDWSFPKGKLDRGETEREAAIREVEEETGAVGVLGEELPTVSYFDHKGRPKTVRYWVMEYGSGVFEPNDEVDELRWVSPDVAAQLLSYAHDADLLAAFEARPEPTTS